MFKLSLRLKVLAVVLFSIVLFGLLFGHPIWSHFFSATTGTQSASAKTSAPLITTVTIPHAQDLFTPFVVTVPLHSTVTWRNDDTVAHVVTTTLQKSNFLNPQAFSFQIPAGEKSAFTFSKAGLYHYYDTTTSSWNATLSRVRAKNGSLSFPVAMDGVIWVQGLISGSPTAAINHVIANHDEFSSEFVAISEPGGVTWHNFDADAHFVGLVAGWSAPINPVDIGLYRVAGTDDTPGGSSITVLFNTPGLYYYYCRNHDIVDQRTKRAQALPMASEYPIPMEGFVLVTGA